MRRSIRSSLFLLVAPFALTFTLVAWVVSSKIGPWLGQPLIANCGDKGYSDWLCDLQAGLMPWLFLGAGILILLSITATLSLSLFRAHLRELQHDVLEFQKGHRARLASDAPWEMAPLTRLLNRILQSGADSRLDEDNDLRQSPPAAEQTQHPAEPVRRTPPAERPAPPRESAPMNRNRARTATPPPPEPRKQAPPTPPQPQQPPEPQPDPEDVENLEVSLEELDADLDKALSEPVAADPEPRPEPAPKPKAPPRPSPDQPRRASRGPETRDRPRRPPERPDSSASGNRKNLAFPSRKCRKLIAMLGHRYPDVNFDLITDVAESDPWTIREAELTEIFGQLLDNAGRWAESQVNIFLAIKGNMLVFGVADDGPGVAPDALPHLGEAGFRVKADEPAGEGLVAVRRTLDAHGGSLAFDRSRLGGLEAIAAIPGSPLPRHVSDQGIYH